MQQLYILNKYEGGVDEDVSTWGPSTWAFVC